MAAPRSMKSKISAESRNCPTVSVRWVTFGPACAIWRHREDHKSTRCSRGCYSLRGLEPVCRNSGLPARSQPQRSSTATATLHPPQAIQTPELTLFRKKEEEGSGFRWRWTRQGREWRGKGNPERKPPKTCPCPCPCPCGSTQAPTLLTSGARARVMGDWRRLSPTKPSNRLNQPLLVAKKVRQPSEPEPKPTPSLATTHTKQNASKQANRWDRD